MAKHIDPPRLPHLTDPLEDGMKNVFKITMRKMVEDIKQTLIDDTGDNKKSTKTD